MKKSLWVLACLCLWGWLLPPSAQAQNDQRYQADSFSFTYPAAWVLSDTRSPQGLIFLSNSRAALDSLTPATGEVVVAIAPPRLTAALAPEADRPLSLIKYFLDDTDAAVQNVRLDNGPAAKVALFDDGYDNLLVSVALDREIALVIATAPLGELAALDDTIMQVVASMRLNEVVAPRLNATFTMGALEFEFRYPSSWYVTTEGNPPLVFLLNSYEAYQRSTPQPDDIGIAFFDVPSVISLSPTAPATDLLSEVARVLGIGDVPVAAIHIGDYEAAQLYYADATLEAYVFVIKLNPSHTIAVYGATANGGLEAATPTIMVILQSLQSLRNLTIRIIG